MGKKYSLRPETYKEIIERDQTPVPPQITIELMAKCEAYASADRWTAYLLKNQKYGDAQRAAQARDRLYAQVLPMLDALRAVRAETAPGEGAASQER